MRVLPLLLGLSVLALAACGDSGGAKPAGSASSAAPADAKGIGKAPTADAKPAKPELEEVKNDAMGYTLKVPKGATTSMSDANGGSYSFDTMVILVGPTGMEIKSADDVLAGVNTADGKVEKKEAGDVVYAVVKAPSSPVKVYAGPKGKKIASTCMAEPDHEALAIEICTSIKSTK